MSKQGKFVNVTQRSPFSNEVSASLKTLSHLRLMMRMDPWILFWGTPSSSERRPSVACWTLRGSLESYVQPNNLLLFSSDVLMSFNALMMTQNVAVLQLRTGYDGLGGRTKFIQPVSFFFSFYVECVKWVFLHLNYLNINVIIDGRLSSGLTYHIYGAVFIIKYHKRLCWDVCHNKFMLW